MKRRRHPHRVAALLVASALLLAACGGSIDEQVSRVDDSAPVGPAVAGVCAPGEPDCDDTIVVGEDPAPLPSADEPDGPDDSAPTLGAALVDGGLSVAEALATDATGTLAVNGFIVDDGVQARLCETLAESFPPQCGGTSIPVSGHAQLDLERLGRAEGVTWTEGIVVVFGEVIDGTLIANPNVAG